MTPQEFLDEVICIYKKSRQVTLPTGFVFTNKIRRGRNHTVSSMMEDLFACFLLTNFPTIDKIAIDQPLTIQQLGGKAKVIYPDLLLIKNDLIKGIVDIKTDMGRKRGELESVVINSSNYLIDMQGATMYYKDGITKERFEVTADKQLHGFIVVISRKNITAQQVEKHLSNIRANRNIHNTQVYFLTDGLHPNHAVYRGQPEKVQILPDFEQLINDLKRTFYG